MKTVNNLDELPAREDRVTVALYGPVTSIPTWQAFVRSKSEPRVLMDYHSGECYRRADGENWEWPAYERNRKIEIVNGERTPTPWSTLTGKGAFCDSQTFPPKAKKVAA